MGFTLRFMLGLILVLATCSVLECASSWRHIRQAPPLEDIPAVPIPYDGILNSNQSRTEESVQDASSNATTSNSTKTEELSVMTDNVQNNGSKHESAVESKPKTETNTEKQANDNKLNVNKISTNNSNTSKLDKELKTKNVPSDNSQKAAEGSLKKPLLINDSSSAADSVRETSIKREPENADAEVKVTTEKVPEIKELASATRADSARSLDIDITKYVSPEFHNKNNVYSFSVSPDTEKYTNLHNELPKSTTSRLHSKEISRATFGAEPTTPINDDFDTKYQNIEEGVRQKLEYIDHQFPDTEHDFKKTHDDDTINISKILDEPKTNDTVVDLNYTKFKNITNNYNKNKNNVHKEIDMESGQNIDYSSSYNKTHVFDEQPKDYKNKIPTHEEDLKPDILPEHSETKNIHRVVGASNSTEGESESINDKIPEIVNFKDSTSLTKPPSLNKTESQTSLLSNRIETEVPNTAENNMKLEWDLPYSSTTAIPPTTTRTNNFTLKSGQEEESAHVSYGRGNSINVSKRGSTRYIDTVRMTTTTETVFAKKNEVQVTSTSKPYSVNKLALANKENKTIEQTVLENQVFPVQIPSPNKESKDEKTINDTTDKSVTTEGGVLPLKVYTVSHTSSPFPSVTQKVSTSPVHSQTEVIPLTTERDDFTTPEVIELTTMHGYGSLELNTLINTASPEETTESDFVTGTSTVQSRMEMTTPLEHLATVSDTEIVATTTVPNTEALVTDKFDFTSSFNEFTTTTYQSDTAAPTEKIDDTTQRTAVSEMISSEDIANESTYQSTSVDDMNSTTTVSTYEDSGSTSFKNDSELDERFNNGRDLKPNSNQTDFSSSGLDYQTIEENSNNLDLSPVPTTTERNMKYTPKNAILVNRTSGNGTNLGTTSDYRENIIIKQVEPITAAITTSTTTTTARTTTIKHVDEASHELVSKHNLTEFEGEDDGSESETEDEIDPDSVDPTVRPRIVKPNVEGDIPDTTPLIIPLNVSMLETDTTDSTTIGDNLGLDSDETAEGSGGPIAAIVISCIGAVCLIILAGLLFVMRKRHKRFNYGQRCTPVSLDAYSVDNVSVYNSMRRKGGMRASKRSYGNPAFEDPSSTTHSLNFPALAKFANNVDGIAAEFEEIPQVTAQTNELPEGCETKNRYANVIPLPETRVYLNAIDGYPNSDYINANYVTGPRNTRGYYIACQAPMQNTVDDFWRMIWEQQSKVIIMLTHLFENGSEKCIDYLPPSEVLDCHRLFGDFQITLKKREVKEKYVISSLQLKNMVSNSWREVSHLWYLGWPEKGVPLEANSLIAFLIEARSYIKAMLPTENGKPNDTSNDPTSNGSINSEQSPMVIHCSPGTGRTGTVIACDIAIREFELTRQVDIPKTVYRIRRDRASSVQTKEQYGFIYKVITLYATKLTGGVLDSL